MVLIPNPIRMRFFEIMNFGPNGQLEGIYGPGNELYAYVMNFSD